jgi:hypothetical protein
MKDIVNADGKPILAQTKKKTSARVIEASKSVVFKAKNILESRT